MTLLVNGGASKERERACASLMLCIENRQGVVENNRRILGFNKLNKRLQEKQCDPKSHNFSLSLLLTQANQQQLFVQTCIFHFAFPFTLLRPHFIVLDLRNNTLLLLALMALHAVWKSEERCRL